jgi:PTS system mannose-specific IIA component
MIGVVVITRGDLGDELIKAAFKVMGTQERVKVVKFLESEGREDLLTHTIDMINQVEEGDGTLLLMDLFTATYAMVAEPLFKKAKVEIVTGVNLPMILEVFLYRSTSSLQRLKTLALEGGKKGILSIRENIKARLR